MTDTPAPPPLMPETDRPTSGLAVTALVLGILGVLTSCIGVGVLLGIAALILGIVAVNKIGSEGNVQTGKGLAIAGIVTGGLTFLLLPMFALLIGILLPALGAARDTAIRMQNSTQARGIHQAMVTYANGNNSYFPGISRTDDAVRVVDPTVAGRFQALLDNNYFTGEYLINPAESSKATWIAGPVTPNNYSYALLEIGSGGGRQYEWSWTLNAQAVVLSDRNAGSTGDPYSVFTGPGEGWRGSVAYNDNHVEFEFTHVLETQYGAGEVNRADDLFEAAGDYDAYMIHTVE